MKDLKEKVIENVFVPLWYLIGFLFSVLTALGVVYLIANLWKAIF